MIIEKGDDVHMECSSDTTGLVNPITWSYDGTPVTNQHCVPINGTHIVVSRLTTDDCYIIGYGNATEGNHGTYGCSDGTGKTAEAIAILIGNNDTINVYDVLHSICKTTQLLRSAVIVNIM